MTNKVIAFFGLLVLATAAFAVTEKQRASIEENITSVAKVCVEGDDCGSANAAAAGPQDPADIYQSTCLGCHSTGAGGAPKIGDAGAWAARLDKGIDTVYANAINGINAMPAKGLCMSCSDDDIKAVVDYILAESK